MRIRDWSSDVCSSDLSTTGGAVLITPKKPTDEFDGFFEASLGNYSAREFTGAINIPIVGDRLAVRIAGNYRYHDGYAKSLTTGQDLDDRDRSSSRITLPEIGRASWRERGCQDGENQ